MSNFFKNVLSSCLGTSIALFIGIFVLPFILIAGMVAALSNLGEDLNEGGKMPVTLTESTILRLNFDSPLVEKAKENPLSELDLPVVAAESAGLVEYRQAIKRAAEDPNIKGIYLNLEKFNGGYASIQELRQALVAFKESGKPIYAYASQYSQKSYYLASAADKVYLNPAGGLIFSGIETELMFFEDMLKRLDIQPQIFRVGKFKSAVEPLIRKDMSEANRLQVQQFIESIFGQVVREVAQTRGLDSMRVRNIADSMLVRQPSDAVQVGLIDSLKYYDQVLDDLRAELALDAGDDIPFVDALKYANQFPSEGEKIAVIVATGQIMPGKNKRDILGGDEIAKNIRQARLDDDVKAIVIRVNSPGGSALASDVMWREVKLASEVKPVIASMSDVAASGGYYMSMACDTIVAQPTTITGSIGVFGVVFNIEKFLENKLGITTDRVATGPYANVLKATEELSKEEREIIQKEVERIYKDFTTKAAQGRGMNVDSLREVAGGRVWTGADAQKIGLVDILGGLGTAVDIAAEQAGVSENYSIEYLPKKKGFFELLNEDLLTEAKQGMVEEELGPNYQQYKQLKNLQQLEGTQALMPFWIKTN